MELWAATILVIHGASIVGSMPAGGAAAGIPENITIMFLTPSEVKVSWKTAIDSVEKYDVTYKPTDASYRVVVVVAGNSDSVTLTGLTADTQYSVTVTAVRGGKKFKSRPVVFRTLGLPTPQEQQVQITGNPPGGGTKTNSRSNMPPPYLQSMSQVRGIEVGIVCLVLLVWVGSIVLFFNRWGKIRMLLPYQPDYKDTQLKVPGSGACQLGGPSCQNTPGTAFCCPQRFVHRCGDDLAVDWSLGSDGRPLFGRPSRSRINSAIYIATHHRSEEHEPLFDATLTLVRKAKSADNLPMSDYNTVATPTGVVGSRPGTPAPARKHEVPILSVSVASEKPPVVEQHL